MIDAGLFVNLAEIAGVFVGFGALIAVRSEETSDAHTVEYLRALVGGGLMVVVSALAPVAVSRFGIEGHALWLSCSIFFLVLFLTEWIADARSPENRMDRKANLAIAVRYAVIAIPMTLCLMGSLVLIIIGVWPQHEPALYFLAVTLALVETGLTLFWLVWTRNAAKPPAPPA